MRILSWNINGARGHISAERGTAIVDSIINLDVDVVLLQEVPRDYDFVALARLRVAGFPDLHRPSGFDSSTLKGYSTVIASRIPTILRSAPSKWEKPGDFCVVEIDGNEYASCHIPNGSGNNLSDPETKQRHLFIAAEWLHERSGRFLGGDLNEPWAFKDGRAVSWADKGPRFNLWRESVSHIFNEGTSQHLCASLHVPTEPESVRFMGNRPPNLCWYDHAIWNGPPLASTAEYRHELNHEKRLSDHSPLVIEF